MDEKPNDFTAQTKVGKMAIRKDMKTFDFDDVMLVPKKGILHSRSQADVSVSLGGRTFNIPAVPANMSTIIDENLAEYLAKNGYFYIIHRFDIDPVQFVKDFNEKDLFTSISLGVKEADYKKVDELSEEGLSPDYITIDIAHGHAQTVIDMIKYIKEILPETYVIAGNVGSVVGALELEGAGADCIKVGIAPGFVCTTGHNTGCGTRGYQLSSVEEVADALQTADLIADGGIRKYGDIAKAIALGADMVMVGSMFAGHDENPGEVVEDEEGKQFKVYFGSASDFQKGEKKYVEGRKELMPYKGAISETLRTIKENLQSSVSYAGGRELSDLRNVEYVLLNNY